MKKIKVLLALKESLNKILNEIEKKSTVDFENYSTLIKKRINNFKEELDKFKYDSLKNNPSKKSYDKMLLPIK